jgi:hypothetical protein
MCKWEDKIKIRDVLGNGTVIPQKINNLADETLFSALAN